MKHFLFDQIDSWFFKEARSMDNSGAAGRDSIFPPPSKTLLGAIRHQIGCRFHQEHNTNWSNFAEDACSGLRAIIGDNSSYASLQAEGVWLFNTKEQQLYFPLPANLLKQDEPGTPPYTFFPLGKAVCCDLGTVHLPAMDFNKKQGTLENAWISAAQFSQVLTGQAPASILPAHDLFATEPRLGIGLNRDTRTVQQGLLFLTRHLRLRQGWSLYLGVEGIAEETTKKYVPGNTLLRLGGEGRMARSTLMDCAPALPQAPALDTITPTDWLVLYLITPLPDWRGPEQKNMPPLPGKNFEPLQDQDSHAATFWRGTLCGLEMDIISAVVGKVERIGGWDLAKHQSTPVKSYLPAGSCWYIRPGNIEQARKIITALHGKYLTSGPERALGLGHVLIGTIPAPLPD